MQVAGLPCVRLVSRRVLVPMFRGWLFVCLFYFDSSLFVQSGPDCRGKCATNDVVYGTSGRSCRTLQIELCMLCKCCCRAAEVFINQILIVPFTLDADRRSALGDFRAHVTRRSACFCCHCSTAPSELVACVRAYRSQLSSEVKFDWEATLQL